MSQGAGHHSVIISVSLTAFISVTMQIMRYLGAALLAVWWSLVSDLAGGGRMDVHGVHLQPGGHQYRPVHSRESTDPLRQSHDPVTSQAAHHYRLDSVAAVDVNPVQPATSVFLLHNLLPPLLLLILFLFFFLLLLILLFLLLILLFLLLHLLLLLPSLHLSLPFPLFLFGYVVVVFSSFIYCYCSSLPSGFCRRLGRQPSPTATSVFFFHSLLFLPFLLLIL